MPISLDTLELENRGYAQNGEPVLIDAYRSLKEQWNGGDRDRELGLHLIFLSWYGLVEPPFVFGEYDVEEDRLQETFNEVFEYFRPQMDSDPEFLYVVGLAAHLFPFMLGNETEWENRAIEFQKKYRQLKPDGIEPQVFENRGAYGKYYGHMAKVEGGY
jgi:hypothetical protein